MISSNVLLKLISSSVPIAAKAGGEIRRIYNSGRLGVVSKGFRDYQTEADRLSQAVIVSHLSRRFPKCKICGEEDGSISEEIVQIATRLDNDDTCDQDVLKQVCPKQYESIREEDITIWIDPMDGTSEFVSGLPEPVTILIGFSVNKRAVGGVIHQVFHGYTNDDSVNSLTGRTTWGLVGLGCFGLKPNLLPNDRLIVTTTASHGNAMINTAIDALNPYQIVRVGGAGHKVLTIIEGKANCYVFASNGCKKWDTCAAEALLEATGGRMTDILGNLIEYTIREDGCYKNSFGVLASSNEDIHEKVLNKIPDEVKIHLQKNAT